MLERMKYVMEMVEFPGLGLKFAISNVAFSIFGFPVYWYGVIMAVAILIPALLASRSAEKFGLTKDHIADLLLIAIPSAVVGARLYYVAFKWEDFGGDLFKIINVRTGGLAIYGAIIGACLSALIYTKVKKIPVPKIFDYCVAYFPLGQAIGRWGNFFNQEAFGRNTLLPWGMKSETISSQLLALKEQVGQVAGVNWIINPDLPVHPTFLYESIWNLGLFIFLIIYRKRKKFEGEIFALFMAMYGLGRFFIEGLRTDSLMAGSLRISQFLAVLFFGIFLAFIIKKRKQAKASLK